MLYVWNIGQWCYFVFPSWPKDSVSVIRKTWLLFCHRSFVSSFWKWSFFDFVNKLCMLEAHSIWTSLGEVLSKFIIWTAKVFLLGLTGLETRAQIQFHFGFLITTGINGLTGTSGRASQLCRKWWTRILVFLHPMRNVIHLQTFGILCHFSSSLNHHHLPTSDHTLAQNFPTCQPEIDGFIWWKSPLLLEYLPLAKNELSYFHSCTLIIEVDKVKSIKIF